MASGWKMRLALLWLAGTGIRLTILAVPPVVAEIHRQLRLDETTVGVLTGLPTILLAVAAVPGSLLVAKIGPRRALAVGLCMIAAAGAGRGLGPSLWVLLALTFVMGCGAAVSQPAMPSLVRLWLPDRVGMATAVFSNGMLVGEVLPVALTGTVILTLLAGSWEQALAVWSIPVTLTAVLILVLIPQAGRHAPAPTPARWWPDWNDATTWRLGGILGGASAAYWGANAFIPDFLKAHHHGALITAALTSLNVIQLPASMLVAFLPGHLIGRRIPLMVAGASTVLAAIGLAVLPVGWVVADAGLLGFSTAFVFVLALALPPVLAQPGDTHRLSAAMFTISYSCPFLGALLGGGLWDRTGLAFTAFTPLLVGGLMILVLPAVGHTWVSPSIPAGVSMIEAQPNAEYRWE